MKTAKPSTRRLRQRGETQLETVINSMTMDQLRTTLGLLSNGPPPPVRTLDEAAKAILDTGRAQTDLLKALYEVERRTPFRHCVAATYTGKADGPSKGRKPPQSDLLRLSAILQDGEEVWLTLEHDVLTQEWVRDEKNPRRRELTDRKVRHPIVIHLVPSRALVLVHYPGINQGTGLPTEERINYPTVVTNALDFTAKYLGIEAAFLPIRECLRTAWSTHSARLKVVRSSGGAGPGEMSLAAGLASGKSVADVLADFLAPYLPETDVAKLTTAAEQAAKESNLEQVFVAWPQEQLVSRISFWQTAAEFLFYWGGNEPSHAKVTSIFELLDDVRQATATSERRSVWNYLAGTAPGTLFLPQELASKFSLSPTDLQTEIRAALQTRILTPVYRLNTKDELQDFLNDWTSELSTLGRGFRTTRGDAIDGREPANVEIAFRRTALAGATAVSASV